MIIDDVEINSDIELTTVELTNTPTTYDIYIWVDKDISQVLRSNT